jgi:cold shock CspA family protein
MSKQEIKTGNIKFTTKKGYGFITNIETQEDIFFHLSGCVNPSFDKLEAGDTVNYVEAKQTDRKKAIEIVTI